MARYLFQAKNAVGHTQTGQIEALDEFEVRSKLKSQNLTPLRIIAAPSSKGQQFNFFQSKVPSKELLIFTRQFSTLINAGIPIVDALKILSEGKRNERLKEGARQVKQYIESGKRLADAMHQQPDIFDRFYVNMVRAGEEAGILDNILLRLSTYMEKSDKIKKQITGALAYPAVIVALSFVVIAGILVFVIPKFQELFAKSGKELPALTKFVVALSELFIHQWYLVLAAMVAIPYFAIKWYQSDEGRAIADKILIQAPVFGDLIQKASVARMTRTLSTLLAAGVSVIDALDIASKTAGNKVIEEALVRSKESVIAGKALATPLFREKMIPDMVTQMIAIGEQSGTIDVMLGKISDFYEDDVEAAVKAMTSLIEPLLMVFLGAVIAVLVLAMYLPIFDLANVTTGGM